MAKWGEGDPRWIVEERPDATNVNNWHWTEKSAASWSKTKLESLLVGLVIDDDKVGRAEITKLEKCEGDASANNRKAKLIFFYEWDLKLAWKGLANGSDKEVKGVIKVPNLSDENDQDDLDIYATVETSGREADVLKELMCKQGAELVRAKLADYIHALKTEFTSGMILPSQKDTAASTKSKPAVTKSQFNSATSSEQRMVPPAAAAGTPIPTATLSDRQQFKCTADELFSALTQQQLVAAFTGGAARVTPEPGGEFSLLGGNISGTFSVLEAPARLEQRWRLKSWPAGHLSNVTIRLEQKDDCTELTLNQTMVPASELERTRQGWQRYYWDAIRRCFGFGAPLL